MESTINSATKVLIDPWNHDFSTPKKCLASLVTLALFPTLIFHISSFVWRYYHHVKENDTQDAIIEKMSALFQKIFPSTASSYISINSLENELLKDILKKENLSQLPLYSKEPLAQDAELPDFISLQRPIIIVQQIGVDGQIKTFMAFKLLADIQSKQNPNLKWIKQSAMYLQVNKDNLTTVGPMKMQDEWWKIANVDEKDQLALLNSLLYDAEFKQENDHKMVSYRLCKEAPSFIPIDHLKNKNLEVKLKRFFDIIELPLYSKMPLSKEKELPDFKDLQELITIVQQIGDDGKIHTFMAVKIEASCQSDISYGASASYSDFLVLYVEVHENGDISHLSLLSKTKARTEIKKDDQEKLLEKLFEAIMNKTPFKRKVENYNISYQLTSYLML